MAIHAFSDRILAPIIATAERLDWPERRAFLDDLRRDAPALIDEVERRLAAPDVSARSNVTVPRFGLLAWMREFMHFRLYTTPQ